jgi:hypothetical protein
MASQTPFSRAGLRTSVPFLDLTFQTDFGGFDPRALPQLLLIVRQRLLHGRPPCPEETRLELLMSRLAIRHLVCQGGGGPKYQVPADVAGTPIEENWRKNEPPGSSVNRPAV